MLLKFSLISKKISRERRGVCKRFFESQLATSDLDIRFGPAQPVDCSFSHSLSISGILTARIRCRYHLRHYPGILLQLSLAKAPDSRQFAFAEMLLMSSKSDPSKAIFLFIRSLILRSTFHQPYDHRKPYPAWRNDFGNQCLSISCVLRWYLTSFAKNTWVLDC